MPIVSGQKFPVGFGQRMPLITTLFTECSWGQEPMGHVLVVYKKHYPSESDVFWQSKPQVTKSRLNNSTLFSNYAGFVSLMRAVGIPKPK